MSTVVRAAVIGGVLALGALIAAPAHAAEATEATTMTLIGTEGTQAVGVNSRGQVAVDAQSRSNSYIWHRGKVTPLPDRFSPVAINEKGHVAGNIRFGDVEPFYQAAIWRDGKLTVLSTERKSLYATGMNDRDEVVGEGPVGDRSLDRAFVWRNGTVTDLDTPAGFDSYAKDINNKGEIVGFTRDGVPGPRQAVIWRGGVRTALGAGITYAAGINDRSEIAVTTFRDNRTRAGVWRRGVVTLMDAPNYADAAGINERGDVTGWITRSPSDVAAFRWRAGKMRELGPGSGYGINNGGQVVGQYEPAEGGFYAATWS